MNQSLKLSFRSDVLQRKGIESLPQTPILILWKRLISLDLLTKLDLLIQFKFIDTN